MGRCIACDMEIPDNGWICPYCKTDTSYLNHLGTGNSDPASDGYVTLFLALVVIVVTSVASLIGWYLISFLLQLETRIGTLSASSANTISVFLVIPFAFWYAFEGLKDIFKDSGGLLSAAGLDFLKKLIWLGAMVVSYIFFNWFFLPQ